MRRTGLKPQAVQSLVMAGAFDAFVPNRRIALWDAGLPIRPSRNGQRAFPVSGQESVPNPPDFTEYEQMMPRRTISIAFSESVANPPRPL